MPEAYWEAAIRHLERGQESLYWVILDENWRITAASEQFQSEVLSQQKLADETFLGTLSPGVASDVSNRRDSGTLLDHSVELVHPLICGSRAVAYQFYRVENDWIALGRDQSRQIERVTQMSCLREDMELDMRKERDLADRLRSLLSNDELTGLANRRKFRELLTIEWNFFIASGENFCVVSLDIDHFKSVNDRFGHPVGDEGLKRIAKALEASVRGGDTVARVGGEEFLVLTAGADSEAGKAVAERIRRRVEMTPMPGGVGTATVSLGVASTEPHPPEDVAELISQSDLALYAAKNNGRNCVEVARPTR